METACSLPCTQKLAIGLYHEPCESNTHKEYDYKIILILSSHLLLGPQGGIFSSGFPAKILCAFHTSYLRTTHSTHLILLELMTLITFDEEYK
jgi:hypothetical protein